MTKKKDGFLGGIWGYLKPLIEKKLMVIMIGIGIGIGQCFYQIIIQNANKQSALYLIDLQKDQEIDELKNQLTTLEKECFRGKKTNA